jgi:uncharacterized protein (TIGR00730 family)
VPEPSTADHICVFCGSSVGANPQYAEAASRIGRGLAERGLGLVYGGGSTGLMGITADACLGAGGRVVGVIPEPLTLKEITHHGLTELHVVPGMHERKAMMAQRASAFLTLPGGVGTFEEFFEILTWGVLGLQEKPIGILNVAGYYDPLLHLIRHAVAERFFRSSHLDLLVVSDDPEAMLDQLTRFRPPPAGPVWIDREQT